MPPRALAAPRASHPRHALERQPQPDALRPFAARYLPFAIPAARLELHGLYAFLEKEPFGEYRPAVLDTLGAERDRDILGLGDLNTGQSEVDAPVKDFYCSEFFTELPQRGYVDLWRRCAGADEREYSWQGKVNPYQLEHAFETESLARRERACAFSHAQRFAGISDHSLLSVSLDT